jgi:hypothetical protein
MQIVQKASFGLRQVHFLRRIINEKGILVDPSKIEAVNQKFNIFLGLAGYYRRFIENFSKICPDTNTSNSKGWEVYMER